MTDFAARLAVLADRGPSAEFVSVLLDAVLCLQVEAKILPPPPDHWLEYSESGEGAVRLRISSLLYTAAVAKLKKLADLDVAEKHAAQQGCIHARAGTIRVRVDPNPRGESVSIVSEAR